MAKKVRQPSPAGFVEPAAEVAAPAPSKKKEKKAVEEPKAEEPQVADVAPSEPEVISEDSF